MEGIEYQRPPYPATWARMHGQGRVFYTSMGHREDVWTNDTFVSLLLGGLGWAVGNAQADVTPNALLGRVSATILMATAGARPLGAALGAILASTLGTEACLVAAAGGFALQVVTILTSPVPRLPALPRLV